MKLNLRYFASIREALGPGESIDFDGATLGALRDALIARGGSHAEALGRSRNLRAALNHAMADDAAALQEGDEVAFFPPVTGG
ncbi:MAG TPA: MoaD/ThiS family protein [Methylibium sp.]|uniref:MoaD/ThiS family protein n=1 Tax=Methylibium sp. TaxID=2067992 RepID=UPI002DBB8C58|nr:MoaD/ThiS family protein [Methylibium sp.]HEU4460779.1 MoaD/ThiS family protein [Methylibium sp.]